MSVEKITARILQEAQDEAAALKAKAEAERCHAAEGEGRAAMQTLTMQQKAQTDALLLKERRKSVAELEARKLRLRCQAGDDRNRFRRSGGTAGSHGSGRIQEVSASHFWLPTTSR